MIIRSIKKLLQGKLVMQEEGVDDSWRFNFIYFNTSHKGRRYEYIGCIHQIDHENY